MVLRMKAKLSVGYLQIYNIFAIILGICMYVCMYMRAGVCVLCEMHLLYIFKHIKYT